MKFLLNSIIEYVARSQLKKRLLPIEHNFKNDMFLLFLILIFFLIFEWPLKVQLQKYTGYLSKGYIEFYGESMWAVLYNTEGDKK